MFQFNNEPNTQASTKKCWKTRGVTSGKNYDNFHTN